MSSDQPRRMARGPASSGASPAGSTVAIVIAVIAVLLGILILRSIRDDDGGSGSVSTTAPGTTQPVVTQPPASTVPPIVTQGATVVVANAAGVKEVAGKLTTALSGKQFTVGTATNAAAPEKTLETSRIYFDPAVPAAEAVARSVGRLMNVTTIGPLPTTVPVSGGKLEAGASVLVMLGKDKASLTLDQMTAGATATTTTTTTRPAAAATTTTRPAATTTTRR